MFSGSIPIQVSRADTLDEVWRRQLQRTSRPTLVVCTLSGIIGLLALVVSPELRIASLLLVVAGAFGLDGLSYRVSIARAPSTRRPSHVVSVIARSLAIGAALMLGLLILMEIFGGGAEVMR
jgi:hypothetical protein